MANHTPQKGERGFDLDIHLTFREPLPPATVERLLQPLGQFRTDLYRPHPNATATPREVVDQVPAARLIGPMTEPVALRTSLAELNPEEVRTLEVGLRGYLRSSDGSTEWMPWKRNVILGRQDLEAVKFEAGVRYILEERSS